MFRSTSNNLVVIFSILDHNVFFCETRQIETQTLTKYKRTLTPINACTPYPYEHLRRTELDRQILTFLDILFYYVSRRIYIRPTGHVVP